MLGHASGSAAAEMAYLYRLAGIFSGPVYPTGPYLERLLYSAFPHQTASDYAY